MNYKILPMMGRTPNKWLQPTAIPLGELSAAATTTSNLSTTLPALTPYYDSILAQLIVRGESRAEVLSRSAAALDAFEVEGVSTTIGFQRAIIEHCDFIKGRARNRWIEGRLPDTVP